MTAPPYPTIEGQRRWAQRGPLGLSELRGPLRLDAIRLLYLPAENYRISPSVTPLARASPGRAPGRWYVLAGACAIEVGSSSWELQAGDIADIPAGEYRFRASGSDVVELVRAWQLPRGSEGGDA